MKKKKKALPRWFTLISTIVANATIVLSVVYILFYILDGFNPTFWAIRSSSPDIWT